MYGHHNSINPMYGHYNSINIIVCMDIIRVLIVVIIVSIAEENAICYYIICWAKPKAMCQLLLILIMLLIILL